MSSIQSCSSKTERLLKFSGGGARYSGSPRDFIIALIALAPFSHASRKKKGRPTHEIVVLID